MPLTPPVVSALNASDDSKTYSIKTIHQTTPQNTLKGILTPRSGYFTYEDTQGILTREITKEEALGALQADNSETVWEHVLYVRQRRPIGKQLADRTLHSF